MELAKTTWTKVEDYLKNKQSLVALTGSAEQHATNASIGTDYVTANV